MATTSILFTDVVASVRALTSSNDDDGVGRMTRHLRACREVVERNNGRVTKTLGDGIMALFGSAFDATKAAIALQQQTEHAERSSASGAVLSLRVGVHVGEVIDATVIDEGDVFGTAVVIARRLCDACEPGQILVSDLVARLVGDRAGLTFEAVPDKELKGIATPVPAFAVPWDPLAPRAPIRVVIAEDAALIRAGLVRLLTDEGFDIVADVGDYDGLVDAARAAVPDLVITDIRMPPTHTDEGIRAAAAIRSEMPEVAVMVLSQHVEPAAAATLLATNPTSIGYLLKERISEVDEFVEACRSVAGGESRIDPLVTEQLIRRRRDVDTISRLTDREREVLSAMAQGRWNHAIAVELSCSDKTVESHISSIFSKLGLLEHPDDHRRVAAVVLWLHSGQ